MYNILFLSVLLLFHPVHVSLTSIDYIPETDSYEVFVRINFEDFLLDCKANGQEIQNIDFSNDKSPSWNVMEKYLGEKIIIKVNEKQLSGNLKNMNVVDNEINMNLNYRTWKKQRTITVKNVIMTDLYNDQANMVIIKINDFEKGIKLTAGLTEQTFKIQ